MLLSIVSIPHKPIVMETFSPGMRSQGYYFDAETARGNSLSVELPFNSANFFFSLYFLLRYCHTNLILIYKSSYRQ